MVNASPAKPQELTEVHNLFEIALGKDYITKESLLVEILSKNSQIFVAKEGNIIIGAANCSYFKHTELASHLPSEMSDLVQQYLDLKPREYVGKIDGVVVTPDKQKRGIGRQLVQMEIEWLTPRVQKLIIMARIKEETCPAESMLIDMGFIELATVENFWKQDSLEKKYNCPVCKNPCRCSAKLFQRDML
jgi:GNAT superfamily N-acetyltransferase